MTGTRERKKPSKTDPKNFCMRRMREIVLPLSNWAAYLQDKKVQGEGNSKFKFLDRFNLQLLSEFQWKLSIRVSIWTFEPRILVQM